MTTADLVARVRAIIGDMPDFRIAQAALSALRLLPERVKNEDRELYRKDFTVALTGGEGALSSHTNLTSEPLIPTDITKVTHSSVAGKLNKLGGETELNLDHPTNFGYFAVEDNYLYTKYNNSRTALTGNATVHGGFVPSLSGVRYQHEAILIGAVVEILSGVKIEEAA